MRHYIGVCFCRRRFAVLHFWGPSAAVASSSRIGSRVPWLVCRGHPTRSHQAAAGDGHLFRFRHGSRHHLAHRRASRLLLRLGADGEPQKRVAVVCLLEGVLGTLACVVSTGGMPLPGGEFWLPALAALAPKGKAWVRGSLSHCIRPNEQAHVNGNALYALAPQFVTEMRAELLKRLDRPPAISPASRPLSASYPPSHAGKWLPTTRVPAGSRASQRPLRDAPLHTSGRDGCRVLSPVRSSRRARSESMVCPRFCRVEQTLSEQRSYVRYRPP